MMKVNILRSFIQKLEIEGRLTFLISLTSILGGLTLGFVIGISSTIESILEIIQKLKVCD